MSRTTWTIAVGAVVLAFFLGCAYYTHPPVALPQSRSTPPSHLLAQASSTNEEQTYTNASYGFGFSYPSGWSVRENSFQNYYSQFNVEVVPPGQVDLFDPIVVNVVLPEFADRAFVGLETTTVAVGDISGTKYEYEFEGEPKISVVLPFGKNKMIIGTKKKYADVFKRILTSFTFLK